MWYDVPYFYFFFFFNDTATTEIYTLSLHDALPICPRSSAMHTTPSVNDYLRTHIRTVPDRSEEHTSELQSPCNLVCRLLLEKKKKNEELAHDMHRHLSHICHTLHNRTTPYRDYTPS